MRLIQQATQSTEEMAQDFRFGQVVIAIARWFLLALGMFSLLYRADTDDLDTIAIGTGLIWGLTLFNAYLHGRALIRKPVGREMIYLASAIDIAVISILIGLFDGYNAYFFVFYYPAILAFSLVFPPIISFSFTGVVIFVYSLLAFFVGDGVAIDPGEQERVLITRLVVMVAVAAIGTFFWRIERQRRQAAVKNEVESQMQEFRSSLGVRVGQAAPSSPQTCRTCGRSYPADAKFCPADGTALGVSANP